MVRGPMLAHKGAEEGVMVGDPDRGRWYPRSTTRRSVGDHTGAGDRRGSARPRKGEGLGRPQVGGSFPVRRQQPLRAMESSQASAR